MIVDMSILFCLPIVNACCQTRDSCFLWFVDHPSRGVNHERKGGIKENLQNDDSQLVDDTHKLIIHLESFESPS
jgi:hypothetical protein